MARKRKDEVVEEDSVTLEYTGEPAEVISTPNAPVEEPTVVEAKEEIATPAVYVQQKFNIEQELRIAHEQIQHCIDYTVIPGADYKGYYRGKQKEWQMYAYKVRQFALKGGNAPIAPEPVEDRY
ncbi:MAG: hypothetical protein IIY21_21825 [Clostridiales bacterium]|nr:hypothetical protein [Clostridiales bacterium]